ncbi:MAG: cell surface protein SprA, partial [Ignavibacteria bacterium]
EDNSGYYNSPVPGNVLRQTDQTSVDQNVLLNEQSMSLDLRNLVQGQGKFAVKNFNTQPVDLLNYKIIKLFVNGDPGFNYYDTSNYDAAVVVRFGSDTANYYEYRAPIHKDIRPNNAGWNSQNEVQITLSDLTQVKQLRDSVNTLTFFNVPNGQPGAKYGIIGNPTLSSISQISLGVENNHKSIVVHPISGSVWFDELRVLKTDDRSGYAYNFSAALKVADFGTFNFTYATVSPTFHSLEDRFGSRDQTNNWELSGSVNLHNIFNSLLASLFSVKLKDFLSIPFTFSHTESYDLPQYVPGTDIDLQTAIQTQFNSVYAKTGNSTLATIASNNLKIASQNLSVVNRIAVNGFKFTLPGENYFIQEMLNKLQVSYYWNSTRLRSPTDQSNYSWDMGGTIGMTTNIKLMEKLNISIGKFLPLGEDFKNAKLYFFFPFIPLAPLFSNDVTVGASYTRSRGDEQFRNQLLPNPTTRAFTANRNFSLDWKFIENWLVDLTGSYTFGAGSDLTYLETTNDSLKLQRSNGQIYRDIFFNHRLINFGKDLSYSQVINMNPKVNIPGLKKFLEVSGSYRVQYGWSPTLTNVPGNTAGYTADFQSTGFLKLNSLFDLFKSDNTSKINGGGKGFYQNDQNQSVGDLLKIIRGFVPDQVTITYSQTKSLANGGILGNSGFNNFWVNWKTRDDYGPSRLYQLGWGNYPGPRAANIQLSDREGYANSVNISTFITPIFPNNLKISFTYKKLWDNTNQLNYNTDAFGNIGSPAAIFNVRDVSNPIFFPTTNIIPKLAKPTNSDPNANAKEISDSFDKSIASFPFPSWDITLNGIE